MRELVFSVELVEVAIGVAVYLIAMAGLTGYPVLLAIFTVGVKDVLICTTKVL